MDTIKKLNAWLKDPANTKIKLASAMGYRSIEVINVWIRNDVVPLNAEKKLLAIIEKQKGKK